MDFVDFAIENKLRLATVSLDTTASGNPKWWAELKPKNNDFITCGSDGFAHIDIHAVGDTSDGAIYNLLKIIASEECLLIGHYNKSKIIVPQDLTYSEKGI